MKTLRTVRTGLVTAALVLSLGSMHAFAAGPGQNFIDADGDGICDYAKTVCAFIDEDGDGICDHYGDGICDGTGHGAGLRDGSGRTSRGGRHGRGDGTGTCRRVAGN